MSTIACGQDHFWRILYRSAIFESDRNEIPRRITEAERAIVQRARELFQEAENNIDEVRALDSAMDTLHVFRSALKTRARGAIRLHEPVPENQSHAA